MAASSSIPVMDDDGQPPLTPQNDDDFKRFIDQLDHIFGIENESTPSVDAPTNDCEAPTIPTRNLEPEQNFSMSAPQNVGSVDSDVLYEILVSQLKRLFPPPPVPLLKTSSVPPHNNNSVMMACEQIRVELTSDFLTKLLKMANGTFMSPKLEFDVTGLDAQYCYQLYVTFHHQDSFTYVITPIPHSPNAKEGRKGFKWTQKKVEFPVKITNRLSLLPNVAVLATNRKYVPVIIISRFNLATNDFDRIFEKKFPVAAAIHYEDESEKKLKASTNQNGQRSCDSYQHECQVDKENVPAAKNTDTLPMNSSMFNLSNTTMKSVPPQADVKVKPMNVEPPLNSNMFGNSKNNIVPPPAEASSDSAEIPSQLNQNL